MSKIIRNSLLAKKLTYEELVKILEKIINSQLNWKTGLKFLEVIHVLIFELYLPFTEAYKHNKLVNLSNLKPNNNSISNNYRKVR